MYKSLMVMLSLLIAPVISLAAQYTGHITTISVNEKGDGLVFEVANVENDTCQSSWFKVSKPVVNEISPAEFVVKSYFNNSKITIHSSTVCAEVASPSSVDRVTLGTSTQEMKVLIQQIRSKGNAPKK